MFDDPVDYLVHYLECPDETPEEREERIALERAADEQREREHQEFLRRGEWMGKTNLGAAMKDALLKDPVRNKRRR